MMYVPPSSQEEQVSRLTATIIQCFDTGDTATMSDIISHPVLLDDGYQEKSYCLILDFLQQKQQKLLSIFNDLQLKKTLDSTSLQQLSGSTTITLLNYLPDEFRAFRSEYCNELVKIARLLVKTEYDTAVDIVRNSLHLNSLPQSRQRAAQLLGELEHKGSKPPTPPHRPALVLLRAFFNKK